MKHLIITICIGLIFISWQTPQNRLKQTNSQQSDSAKAFDRNKNIGRGMNFGNALEAPNEGDWGLVIKESYVQAIADSGLNSVRLPICWTAHMSSNYPYIIDTTFLHRVDEILNWCFIRNLSVIITDHHFDSLYYRPQDTLYRNMFFSMWKQLTNHYISVDHDHLFFEVLNEPEINLTATLWNQLLPQIIDTVRVIDSDRTVIIDGPNYAYHGSLVDLTIPDSNQNIIVSTRYYLPTDFAQQGAWWMAGMQQYVGTTWLGTSTEEKVVTNDMTIITNWAKAHKRAITIGEYGSIMYADAQSRLTWTNYVRRQFEKNGFSWSYFDFGVVFKAYSIAENKWLDGFVAALTGDNAVVLDGRKADSLYISPSKPTVTDSLSIASLITIPNYCGHRDSIKILSSGTTVTVKSYYTEYIPQHDSSNTCIDSVKLGTYALGYYTIIFDCEYLDVVNTLRYRCTCWQYT